jgi:hypothetical protein
VTPKKPSEPKETANSKAKSSKSKAKSGDDPKENKKKDFLPG